MNVSTGESRKIAEDDFGGPEGSVSALMWGETKLAIFHSSAEMIKLVDPENLHDPEVISAEISDAPLKMAKWLEEQRVLIDEVYPYASDDDGVIKLSVKARRRHLPTQSGLVVLDDSRYITSGFEDQSIQLWSLPDGDLLKSWNVGRWYSSRKISHIAVVQGQLLVASAGGRIEQRSLETGEVLWSIRPCRSGAASFYHSSGHRSLGSNLRTVTDSINMDDRLYYACGTRLGTIQWSQEKWHHESLADFVKLSSAVTGVETIPDSDFAVLTLAEGDVLVLNRKKKEIVQTLEPTQKGNPNGVTYLVATRQLVVVDREGKIHLYDTMAGR